MTTPLAEKISTVSMEFKNSRRLWPTAGDLACTHREERQAMGSRVSKTATIEAGIKYRRRSTSQIAGQAVRASRKGQGSAVMVGAPSVENAYTLGGLSTRVSPLHADPGRFVESQR